MSTEGFFLQYITQVIDTNQVVFGNNCFHDYKMFFLSADFLADSCFYNNFLLVNFKTNPDYFRLGWKLF